MRDQLTSVELLACGAVAGAIGKTMLAPVDRVKLMYMTSKSHSFTLTEAVKTAQSITQQTGVSGLWAGNGAAMLRVVPYSALVFTSFDVYQRAIQRALDQKQGVFTRLTAGAAAGATATLLTYPLDLLRTRVRSIHLCVTIEAAWAVTFGFLDGCYDINQRRPVAWRLCVRACPVRGANIDGLALDCNIEVRFRRFQRSSCNHSH